MHVGGRGWIVPHPWKLEVVTAWAPSTHLVNAKRIMESRCDLKDKVRGWLYNSEVTKTPSRSIGGRSISCLAIGW